MSDPDRELTPIVFVVDDDAGFRRSTERLLRVSGFEARGFASAQEFLGAPRPDAPSCLVLDVNMPGLSGIDLQRELARHEGAPPIVFMTGYGDVPTSVRAMKAGAVEFLTKPFSDAELLAAVRQALGRDREARRVRAELTELQQRLDRLTPREREVMRLVVGGLLNKQVAAELGISEITVKVHRQKVMRKMQAASLPALVRMFERLESQGKLGLATSLKWS